MCLVSVGALGVSNVDSLATAYSGSGSLLIERNSGIAALSGFIDSFSNAEFAKCDDDVSCSAVLADLL
jgi:hypothetical protein